MGMFNDTSKVEEGYNQCDIAGCQFPKREGDKFFCIMHRERFKEFCIKEKITEQMELMALFTFIEIGDSKDVLTNTNWDYK
jgi:hypothetical protein